MMLNILFQIVNILALQVLARHSNAAMPTSNRKKYALYTEALLSVFYLIKNAVRSILCNMHCIASAAPRIHPIAYD